MTDKSTNLMIFPNFPLYSMLKNTTSASANKTLSDSEKEELYLLLLKLTKKEPAKSSKTKNSLVFVPPEKNLKDDYTTSLLDDTSHYDDKEIVYSLIKAYSIDVDNSETEFPYDAKNSKLGLKFDLDVLPTHLQHILLSFLKLDKT